MSDASAPDLVDRASPAAPRRSAAPGVVVLARHGEPALSRRFKLDARAYDRWWAAYEAGGILPGQTPPDELRAVARNADAILSSTRRRAVETAETVAAGRPFLQEPLFVEAPLPAPRWPGFLRFGPRAWGVITRLLWYLGHSGGQESRREAWARARQAADRVEGEAAGGRTVLVLAHGFFNGMVGVELTRRGWRCTRDRGFKYWSARRFERR